jgi:hypothetical protein
MQMKTFSSVVIATFAMVGIASAQPKADPKAGAGSAAPAKADPKAAAPAKAPEMPKPPAEIAEMAKTAGGNWKCTGQGFDMATNGMIPMKATLKGKVDLDGWWIAETVDASWGKAKYKGASYTTYDAGSKKWRRVAVSNDGAQMIGTSDGLKDNKVVFNMDTMSPMGTGSFRDSIDLTDAKAPKMWGEMSMDKGKTWTKVYEITCKR